MMVLPMHVMFVTLGLVAMVTARVSKFEPDSDRTDTLYYKPHWSHGNDQHVPSAASVVTMATRPCPCSDPSLCERITTRAKHEVYVYGGLVDADWRLYDWTKLTTVVEHGKHYDDRMCLAHSHGVRFIRLVTYPTPLLIDPAYRSLWVSWMVANVTYNFLDGINVDFEGSIPTTRPDLTKGLTDLVQELNNTLRSLYPNTQITAAFPYTPGFYGRAYDYKTITDICDFVFLMAYDEGSGTPYAGANSGYSHAQTGIENYMKLQIDPYKMVLGVPWYGYNHKCTTFNQTNQHCKSGSAQPVGYSIIIQTLLPQSSGGRLWNDTYKSPYIDVKDSKTGLVHQIWYDDAMSTRLKYQLAAEMGLRGVGVWQASGLNYSDPQQIKDMWGAFPDKIRG